MARTGAGGDLLVLLGTHGGALQLMASRSPTPCWLVGGTYNMCSYIAKSIDGGFQKLRGPLQLLVANQTATPAQQTERM